MMGWLQDRFLPAIACQLKITMGLASSANDSGVVVHSIIAACDWMASTASEDAGPIATACHLYAEVLAIPARDGQDRRGP
jgi:hypothetical protein